MPLARALGKAFMEGLAREVGLPTQLVTLARRAGYGYRYQDMLDDARAATGRIKYQTQIEGLGYNATVPRGWMSEVRLNQDVRYRVFGTMTVYDPESDSYLSQRVSFYTDDYAKVGDYGQAFYDSYEGRYLDEDLEIMEFKVHALEHNVGYSY